MMPKALIFMGFTGFSGVWEPCGQPLPPPVSTQSVAGMS